MKEFTVTGDCVPGVHYMADTSEKLAQVLALVESGKYFCINRENQNARHRNARRRGRVRGERKIYLTITIAMTYIFKTFHIFAEEPFMKLSKKWRKALRRIYCGIGVAAISITVHACYGVIPSNRQDAAVPGSGDSEATFSDVYSSDICLNENKE